MGEEINFNDREILYKFLIDEFNFKVIEEFYDQKNFGNFYIVLAPKNYFNNVPLYLRKNIPTSVDFLLRYTYDRSVASVEISNKCEDGNDKWYDLSFIKDLIYNPDSINTTETKRDNSSAIEELNNFLRENFNQVSSLFKNKNYPITKKAVDDGLKKSFFLRFPSAKPPQKN